MIRAISADFIFPLNGPPVKEGVVLVRADGTITRICSRKETTFELEIYEGIICPGFINAHCHLELSHLKNRISPKMGMAGFIAELLSLRSKFSEDEIIKSMQDAEAEMLRNGIVAVGDISNNNSSFQVKTNSILKYHTFIEIFSLNPAQAEDTLKFALSLQKELETLNQSASLTAHAPYSMSVELLQLINSEAEKSRSVISIHNQESAEESRIFLSASGSLFETFIKMGIDKSWIRQTGLNSLHSTLPHISKAAKILLVHNTFSTKEDISFANKLHSHIYWCTCPKANLYIEERLPDYKLFIEANARMVVGTDSLASNDSLSILDELKTIQAQYPEIELQTLLGWACRNGAEFFGFEEFGTIEEGKKPGLNLLDNTDGRKLHKNTALKKLI